MAGVPGSGGPPPKRSDQRRRTNEPEISIDTSPGAASVAVPPANSRWHPVAKRWYESLAGSGQARYYEPSDWATAYLLAEAISRDLKPQPVGADKETGEVTMAVLPIKGANLVAYLRGMTALLVTEGDRRRARLELQRPQPQRADHPGVPNLDDYRDRLTS